MNLKKTMENRIRGWIPKESSLPSQCIANPESKSRQKIQLPKGRILITLGWIVLSAVNLLRGDAIGVLFLWAVFIFGISLALDIFVLQGKEMNPKLVVALLLVVISLGGVLATAYVFSVPSSFILRAVVVGLLAAVHVPLLFAVVAYVWGKKELSKKLLGWLAMQR